MNHFSIEISNDPADLDRAMDAFTAFVKAKGIPRAGWSHLQLALDEIVSNIIKYGYDDEDTHLIRISCIVKDDFLEMEIFDDSRPFNVLERSDPDTTQSVEARPIGGLGIFLVKKLLDAHEYTREGNINHLVLRKTFGGRSGPK